MNIDEYINLLKQKQQILNNILEYTKSKTFKKSEDEVERIEYYLKRRQEMFDNLLKLENQIKNLNINNTSNKEVNSIVKENNEIIKNILKLDEEKKEIIDSILNIVKKEIKSIKNISRTNNGYLGTYQNTLDGSLFDSSR